MKLHDILKDFPGSQDGTKTEQFTAGTQAMLSDYLAEIVVREGWARLAQPKVEEQKVVEPQQPAAPRKKTR